MLETNNQRKLSEEEIDVVNGGVQQCTNKYMKINPKKCIGCGTCCGVCPFGSIYMDDGVAYIDETCVGCGDCENICFFSAIIPDEQ